MTALTFCPEAQCRRRSRRTHTEVRNSLCAAGRNRSAEALSPGSGSRENRAWWGKSSEMFMGTTPTYTHMRTQVLCWKAASVQMTFCEPGNGPPVSRVLRGSQDSLGWGIGHSSQLPLGIRSTPDHLVNSYKGHIPQSCSKDSPQAIPTTLKNQTCFYFFLLSCPILSHLPSLQKTKR